jgi:hypothetical protein
MSRRSRAPSSVRGTLGAVETVLFVCAVLGGLAALVALLETFGKLRLRERYRRWRAPKPTPARKWPNPRRAARISSPADFELRDPLRGESVASHLDAAVPYPDAVATSEYARRRLERYRREGLGIRRTGPRSK